MGCGIFAAGKSGDNRSLSCVAHIGALTLVLMRIERALAIATGLLAGCLTAAAGAQPAAAPVELGARPALLVGDMRDGALKTRLKRV